MTRRFALIAWPLLALVAWGCGDDNTVSDAGVVDAALEADGGVQCTADLDCEDGLFCNGAETCFRGLCIIGAPVECSDGIACTVDYCDELADACVSSARDNDGDGVGDISCTDGAGAPLGEDCDDADPNRFPGAVEICDAMNVDEDCDPTTFGTQDIDGDGFVSSRCCNVDGAGMNCGTDCDDTRVNVNMTATEACDGVDNDCNGEVDDGVLQSGYQDQDRDGWGDDALPMMACPGAVGFATQGADCDNTDPARNPGQVEVCDVMDNDCDLDVDEDAVAVPWYADVDADGFGDPDSFTVSCAPVAGAVLLGTDCDDAAAAVNPAAVELCDAIDNDCSGTADFPIPGRVNDFEDDDGDGVADVACGGALGIDCDDTNPATGATSSSELCDGQDNDCDGEVDENVMLQTLYRDIDGDGYGSDVSGSFTGCGSPAGYSARGGDCADSNPNVFPGAVETCNALDDDCNGVVDDDPTMPGGACPCPAGFEDCDGIISNGCETYVRADVDHCGGCNIPCTRANGVGVCTNGICVLGGCDDGFFSCDFIGMNGCETDLSSDINNCGYCGERCDTFGVASNRCTGGACVIDSCQVGFEDCNSDPYDGCETQTDSDILNCGGCGLSCGDATTSGASCAGGSCIFSCRPEFLDCDGLASNGCEEPVVSDLNCGACGNSCPVGSTCVDDPSYGGILCQYPQDVACPAGTLDCNHDAFDGCEVTVSQVSCGCPGDAATNCNLSGSATGDVYACSVDDRFSAHCAATACSTSSTLCGDTCADTDYDVNHCGGCDAPCGVGELCSMGVCVLDCGTSTAQDCDGGGVCDDDTTSDPQHCGFCGNVCLGGVCSAGLCEPPRELTRGVSHACARYSSGTVVCWGDNSSGQLGEGSTGARLGEFVPVSFPATVAAGAVGDHMGSAIAAGPTRTCAIVEENDTTVAVYCWGDGVGTPAKVSGFPVGSIPLSVSVGTNHACALTDVDTTGTGTWEARVYCWGANGFGQLGTGDNLSSVSAQAVQTSGGTDFIGVYPVAPGEATISAGGDFTCAVDASLMDAFCWGLGTGGQLGNGGSVSSTVPVETFIPGAGVIEVQAGPEFACARGSAGLFCWGSNAYNQITNTVTASYNSPQMMTLPTLVTSVVDLAVGDRSVCFLGFAGANNIYCRGANDSANLNPSSVTNPLLDFQLVSSGPPDGISNWYGLAEGTRGAFGCAWSTGGVGSEIWCWGENGSGQVNPGHLFVSGTDFTFLSI